MADEPAYTGFTTAALTHQVRSSQSLPLPGARRAALNLYAESTAAFEDPTSHRVAALLTRCAAALLPTAADLDTAKPDHPAELEAAYNPHGGGGPRQADTRD